MASPTPRRKPVQSAAPPDVVDPIWLLKALAITLLAAFVCGYLSVCFLIYQGGWQRFLTPSQKVDKAPAIPFDRIRFDSAATGQPRLTGWWIPAESSAAPTILFLHDGTGSLADCISTLELLHHAQVNLFAIDYRGFGESDPTHPNEGRMTEDANAALRYLLDTRHLNAAEIIPYGQGLGAVLAARLAVSQANIPALILDNPDPHVFDRIAGESRSNFLPMRLLLRDRFDLTASLAGMTRPKLLLADDPNGFDPARTAANQTYFRTLPDPKFTVTFSLDSDRAYLDSLGRFLDENVRSPRNPAAPGARP